GYVKKAYDYVKWLDDFGKTNPMELAIERLQEEMVAVRARLTELERRIQNLEDRLAMAENARRVGDLKQHVIRLETIAFQLRTAPHDRQRCAEAAHEACL